MEKTRLDKLLTLASEAEQYQLKVFYNASIKMLKEYQVNSTATKLKDMQAADAALEEFASGLEEKYAPDTMTFPNRLAVAEYLKANGWKVSKSTLYNRTGKAKLVPREDGLYYLKDVKKYARFFLKRQDTGQRVQEQLDEQQRKKMRLEIEKLEEDVARSRMKRQVEEGKYIPRDQIELELAGRAAVLDAGLTHLFQSQAGALIEVAGGDPRKTAEVIHRLIEEKNRFLNQYAAAIDFTVEIVGEETEEAFTDEQ